MVCLQEVQKRGWVVNKCSIVRLEDKAQPNLRCHADAAPALLETGIIQLTWILLPRPSRITSSTDSNRLEAGGQTGRRAKGQTDTRDATNSAHTD